MEQIDYNVGKNCNLANIITQDPGVELFHIVNLSVLNLPFFKMSISNKSRLCHFITHFQSFRTWNLKLATIMCYCMYFLNCQTMYLFEDASILAIGACNCVRQNCINSTDPNCYQTAYQNKCLKTGVSVFPDIHRCRLGNVDIRCLTLIHLINNYFKQSNPYRKSDLSVLTGAYQVLYMYSHCTVNIAYV